MNSTAWCRPLIVAQASRVGVDPDLVEAVVRVESDGQRWAWNPEPRYRYFWDVRRQRPFRPLTAVEIASEIPPPDFPAIAGDRDQEWWAQQASWGLMQVMGAVARELGYRGSYLPELCDPEVGLFYGCKRLASDLAWARGDLEQALAAYNGGRGGNAQRPFRNQTYALKVLFALAELLRP